MALVSVSIVVCDMYIWELRVGDGRIAGGKYLVIVLCTEDQQGT